MYTPATAPLSLMETVTDVEEVKVEEMLVTALIGVAEHVDASTYAEPSFVIFVIPTPVNEIDCTVEVAGMIAGVQDVKEMIEKLPALE